MPVGASDVPAFFRDFGVPVEFGGVTAPGIADFPGADSVFGDAKVSGIAGVVKLNAKAFAPMPKSGDRLTVDGRQYAVRAVNPLDDGALVEVKLKDVQ